MPFRPKCGILNVIKGVVFYRRRNEKNSRPKSQGGIIQMKDVKLLNGHIVPPRHRKRTCKQKRLLRLGCTALALTLVMVTGIMTGILPGIGMTAYASPAAYTITWEDETFRTLPSGGTQNGITFSGGKSDYSTNVYSSQITFTLYDEPSHEHNWVWVTDEEPTCKPGIKHQECTRCGDTQSEGTRIDPTGADDYAFTDDSAFTWTKGSSGGLTMEIRNTSGNDADTYGKFQNVFVDNEILTRYTDYTAENGCIVLTLFPDYLQTLSTGEHTLMVVLTDANVNHTFTVAAPTSTDTSASTDTPDTGESIALVVCCAVLMLLAAGGCTFVFLRRRKAQA